MINIRYLRAKEDGGRQYVEQDLGCLGRIDWNSNSGLSGMRGMLGQYEAAYHWTIYDTHCLRFRSRYYDRYTGTNHF